METKESLRKRLKALEEENKRLQLLCEGFKQVAEHYSSPKDTNDNGHFAREVIKDMKRRVKEKKYKSVNYHMTQIMEDTRKSYPIYVEGLFEEYEDHND